MKPLNSPKLVTVFGGSGFVGRHCVRALAKRGYRIRVAVRRPDLAMYLRPLGNVGQVQLVQANLRYRRSVDAALEGADAVVNLVGILRETGRQKFNAVQTFGARAVAEAARKHGAKLVHVSAIGADPSSTSPYGASKGKGEAAVRSVIKDAAILRPSIIFGPEDDFFNRFAAMARLSPVLPLIGGGKTRFQPVYVGDVAETIARAVDGHMDGDKTYELGGPEIADFRRCMEIMLEIIDRKAMLINLPWFAASTIAYITGWLPFAPLTPDQVEMLKTDNVVSEKAIRQKLTLPGIGIQPTAMAAILPSYLVQYRPHGQFNVTSPPKDES